MGELLEQSLRLENQGVEKIEEEDGLHDNMEMWHEMAALEGQAVLGHKMSVNNLNTIVRSINNEATPGI